MQWIPRELWRGETIYIIGGGSSLATFPWELLKDKRVLGCNSAFLLGLNICKAIVFTDEDFFLKNQEKLISYFEKGGTIYSSCSSPTISSSHYIRQVQHYDDGAHRDGIGKNGNTGAAAINLAMILGAKKIRLLGYDMHGGFKQENNWHSNGNVLKGTPALYNKFTRAFSPFSFACKKTFPECEVRNANDNSALECFPKMSMEDLFRELNSCN